MYTNDLFKENDIIMPPLYFMKPKEITAILIAKGPAFFIVIRTIRDGKSFFPQPFHRFMVYEASFMDGNHHPTVAPAVDFVGGNDDNCR